MPQFPDKFKLTQKENVFLAKKQLVQSVYNSAKLEGLSVTFPETQTILDGVNVARLSINEIECILNLRNAWKYALESINNKPFDLTFICKINDYVAREESLEWGALRSGNIAISGTIYQPQIPVEENVKSDIAKILELPTATEQAITYFLHGCRSQLFWDGNKRTSTIVANKIMIDNGVGILSIDEKNLNEFNERLIRYYNTGDMNHVNQFLYDNCIQGMELQRNLIENKARNSFER